MTNEQQDSGRSELIDKLRAVETPQSASTLTELSYRPDGSIETIDAYRE